MQCKNCKYIFEDNEKNYYLCPNCLELIEENLPDDERKRVEIYEISLVYKDKLYNKLINFYRYILLLPFVYNFIYFFVYQGFVFISTPAAYPESDFYKSTQDILFVCFINLFVFIFLLIFVEILLSCFFHNTISNFFMFLLKMLINILIYVLFLLAFNKIFKNYVNNKLLGKTFENLPPLTDITWQINFHNTTFFVFILIIFLYNCINLILNYYKYKKVSQLQESLLEKFSD
jgi:hypothetical protein